MESFHWNTFDTHLLHYVKAGCRRNPMTLRPYFSVCLFVSFLIIILQEYTCVRVGVNNFLKGLPLTGRTYFH